MYMYTNLFVSLCICLLSVDLSIITHLSVYLSTYPNHLQWPGPACKSAEVARRQELKKQEPAFHDLLT